MSKQTQMFRLFQLLNKSEPIATEVLAKELGVNILSVPVYIHEIKQRYKADIESVRTGRRVTAYKLLNPEKVKISEYRKNAVGEIPTKLKSKINTSLADELESATTGALNEKEFADLRSSLGLDFGNNSSGDW